MNEVLKRFLLITFIPFIVISCSHPWLGKTLPVANYPQFTSEMRGYHSILFILEAILVLYRCTKFLIV